MTDDSLLLTPRLVDSLYTEAMLLTDEARAYFDGSGRDTRAQLAPLQRVGFSCEALRITTRLMCVVSWLLSQREAAFGNRYYDQDPPALGIAAPSDPSTCHDLPDEARALIRQSEDLYERIARMDRQMRQLPTNPAHRMIAELAQAF